MGRKNSAGDSSCGNKDLQTNDPRLGLQRIESLLALLAVKGENQVDKILGLTNAGFSAAEVARLVGTTPNTVAVTIYQQKQKARKGPSKKKE